PAPVRLRSPRPEALGHRGDEGGRRPLRPLPPVPERVPLGRRRLGIDARGQGRLRRGPRPRARRLAALTGRALVAACQLPADPRQRPPGQRPGSVGYRAIPGLVAPPSPAEGTSHAVRPPGRAPRPDPPAPPGARPAYRLLR